MSQKLKCQSKLICHQNSKFPKTEGSPKLTCHQNYYVTKTKIGLCNWTFKFNFRSLALIALALSFVFYPIPPSLPWLGLAPNLATRPNHSYFHTYNSPNTLFLTKNLVLGLLWSTLFDIWYQILAVKYEEEDKQFPGVLWTLIPCLNLCLLPLFPLSQFPDFPSLFPVLVSSFLCNYFLQFWFPPSSFSPFPPFSSLFSLLPFPLFPFPWLSRPYENVMIRSELV